MGQRSGWEYSNLLAKYESYGLIMNVETDSMEQLESIPALVRRRFGTFIEERVNPGVQERDASGRSLTSAVFREACEIGLTSYGLPTEIGGEGNNALAWGKVLEQIGYLCQDSSLPLVVSLRAGLIKTIYRCERQDINDRYVIPMVAGARAPAFAYTDGTDPFSFKTTAKKVQQGYCLSGEKLYVTGGETADTFMVYARSDTGNQDDLQVFLVEREDHGVIVTPSDISGLRTAGISQISLRDVILRENRLLVPADGLSHVQQFLNERRAFLVCPILGRMQAIMEDCIDELDRKIRYGNTLTAMQHVQAQVGRMFQIVETSRATLYRALDQISTNHYDVYWDPLGSIAKSFVVDQAVDLVHIAQRLLGGDGYLRSKHYERYLRDFCGYIPGGGSQDTLTVDLGINAITNYEVKKNRRLALEN